MGIHRLAVLHSGQPIDSDLVLSPRWRKLGGTGLWRAPRPRAIGETEPIHRYRVATPRICGGNLSSDRTAQRWFDTSCFEHPINGTLGNSGMTIIEGPGFKSVDFSIFKRAAITERLNLKFRSEFFNLFNNVNFTDPGTTFGTGQFGVISSALDPRGIQFGLKLIF
jgi:hypothetical protein